jgi:hypothetical protein
MGQNKTWLSSGFNTWSLFFLIYINDLLNLTADASDLVLPVVDRSIIIENSSPSNLKKILTMSLIV